MATSLPDLMRDSRARLAEAARRAIHDAQRLCDRARAACSDSAETVSVSAGGREDRARWAAILGRVPATPDRLVVVCAYCHRVQDGDRWTALPRGIEDELMRWRFVLVSHGFCPDCVRDHEPARPGDGTPPRARW
jgi:hypothetical protein